MPLLENSLDCTWLNDAKPSASVGTDSVPQNELEKNNGQGCQAGFLGLKLCTWNLLATSFGEVLGAHNILSTEGDEC